MYSIYFYDTKVRHEVFFTLCTLHSRSAFSIPNLDLSALCLYRFTLCNSQPAPRNPQLVTRNPQPATRNPQPEYNLARCQMSRNENKP
jgi:hypothetical protein